MSKKFNPKVYDIKKIGTANHLKTYFLQNFLIKHVWAQQNEFEA